MRHFIYDILVSKGLSESTAAFLNMIILLIGLLIVAFIIDFITKRILWKISEGIASRTSTNFDDILISNKLPRNIAHIIPLIILIEFVPDVFSDYLDTEEFIEKGLKIIAVFLTLRIVKSFFSSVKDYLKTKDSFKDKPIDSYIQVFMIFGWILGIFIMFAIATGITFFKFIGTLGAACSYYHLSI